MVKDIVRWYNSLLRALWHHISKPLDYPRTLSLFKNVPGIVLLFPNHEVCIVLQHAFAHTQQLHRKPLQCQYTCLGSLMASPPEDCIYSNPLPVLSVNVSFNWSAISIRCPISVLQYVCDQAHKLRKQLSPITAPSYSQCSGEFAGVSAKKLILEEYPLPMRTVHISKPSATRQVFCMLQESI